MGWSELLEKGVWTGPAYQYGKYSRIFKTPSGKFEFRSGNLEARLKEMGQAADELAYLPHYEEAEFLGDSTSYPLVLSTYQPLLNVENGNQNYPWAQEVFLVAHGRGWNNFVEMNLHTAHSLGIKDGDAEAEASWLAAKIATLRIFEDGQGKFNRSLLDVGGAALVVSQFTLYGDARRGRRPSFSQAADPSIAAPLVDRFCELLLQAGVGRVETGEFGAHMAVSLVNDGPVTILLDTDVSRRGNLKTD